MITLKKINTSHLKLILSVGDRELVIELIILSALAKYAHFANETNTIGIFKQAEANYYMTLTHHTERRLLA